MQNRQRRSRRENGGAMVEFAVIAPVLSLLIFGVIQWGYILNAALSVRQAGMVGVRSCGLLGGTTVTGVTAAVNALSPTLSTDSTSCPTTGSPPLCATCTINSGTNDCTCTMNYKLKLFLPFVVPGNIGGRKTLTSQSVMNLP